MSNIVTSDLPAGQGPGSISYVDPHLCSQPDVSSRILFVIL